MLPYITYEAILLILIVCQTHEFALYVEAKGRISIPLRSASETTEVQRLSFSKVVTGRRDVYDAYTLGWRVFGSLKHGW